jgi:hypothetical protein
MNRSGNSEQAQSYTNMAGAARMAADAADKAAQGSTNTGIIKGVAGVASLFTGVPIGIGTAPGGSSIGDPTQIG